MFGGEIQSDLSHQFRCDWMFEDWYCSGQITATSHDLGPQKVAEEGKSPYSREI